MTMAEPLQSSTIREAVGVFTDMDQLNEAVAELETTAFPRHDISVLGRDDRPAGLEADNPDAPRTILIRPEEKVIGSAFMIGGGAYAGGTTAALLIGAVPTGVLAAFTFFGAIAGAAVGAIIVKMFAMKLERSWREHMKRGGMVLWVHTSGVQQEQTACEIMRKHGANGVHVHETQ
jgi:hypothetical protein